jgi:hypothetical protein
MKIPNKLNEHQEDMINQWIKNHQQSYVRDIEELRQHMKEQRNRFIWIMLVLPIACTFLAGKILPLPKDGGLLEVVALLYVMFIIVFLALYLSLGDKDIKRSLSGFKGDWRKLQTIDVCSQSKWNIEDKLREEGQKLVQAERMRNVTKKKKIKNRMRRRAETLSHFGLCDPDHTKYIPRQN